MAEKVKEKEKMMKKIKMRREKLMKRKIVFRRWCRGIKNMDITTLITLLRPRRIVAKIRNMTIQNLITLPHDPVGYPGIFSRYKSVNCSVLKLQGTQLSQVLPGAIP